jgi:hypothetical protein
MHLDLISLWETKVLVPKNQDFYNGLGTFIDTQNQTLYEGSLTANRMHGPGAMYQQKSNHSPAFKYIGRFHMNDFKDRNCLYQLGGSGDTFTGSCKRHNQSYYCNGKWTYSDGTSYIGDVKENYRHGYGTMHYTDGTMYRGVWKRDQKHGSGVFTDAEGKQTWKYYFGGIAEEELLRIIKY